MSATKHHRLGDALRWARADLADSHQHSYSTRAAAGRILGRVHAARGEHSLSIAALDSALQLANTGRFLLSEVGMRI